MKRKKKAKQVKRISILFCTLVYLFLFLPIFVVVANSFNATTSKPYLSWKGFTLDWYVELWDNTALLSSFGNTMMIAVLSTILSTVIGTLAAVGIYRYKFKGKGHQVKFVRIIYGRSQVAAIGCNNLIFRPTFLLEILHHFISGAGT